MARKRKRRKGAGPQPAPHRRTHEDRARAPAAERRKGEPALPSFNGVLIRSVIVAVLFYPYLIFIAGQPSQTALLVAAIAFVVMIPLGMAFDRVRYRMQMKRWRQKREEGDE